MPDYNNKNGCICSRLLFGCNDVPGCASVFFREQTVSALKDPKALFFKKGTNGLRIVKNFVNILFKAEFTVFIDPGLQIDDVIVAFQNLKFGADGIAEGAIEGLTGRYFLLIENIENKITAICKIAMDIAENGLYVG